MLVCQQALLETFVEEFGVVHHDIVNRLHCPQLLLELVVIGLQYLDLHVVHVVFAELEHPVTECVSLYQHIVNIALL